MAISSVSDGIVICKFLCLCERLYKLISGAVTLTAKGKAMLVEKLWRAGCVEW